MTIERKNSRLSWVVTSLSASYVLWCAFVLSRRTGAFAAMFQTLGAELPTPTKVTLAVGRPAVAWPLAAVAVLLLLANELRVRSAYVRLTISFVMIMVAALLMAFSTEALFQPMFQLIRQIG